MATHPEIPEIDTISIFFKWQGLILIASFDSTLNFEFRTSFCQHLSVIVFDLSFFSQKGGVVGLH
jgi:hypothetical protein